MFRRGATIYSDGWSVYCGLNKAGYQHFTIIHKYNFKKVYTNVETKEKVAVHTNRIEGAWKHAKDHFRKIQGTKLSTRLFSNICDGTDDAIDISYGTLKPRSDIHCNRSATKIHNDRRGVATN